MLFRPLGTVGRAFIGFVRRSIGRRQRRELRHGQQPTRRGSAGRTVTGLGEFRHRDHFGKRSAIVAHVIIYRHVFSFPRLAGPILGPTLFDQRSGAKGTSTEPSSCFVGPSAVGIMSKSKISLGNHKVAQALGMSTTPEIWPCTGAVPKIA